MYDCPRCNGVETLRFNLYYEVYVCLACGVSALEEDDMIDEQIVVDYNDMNELVSEYILPKEQAKEAEIDYNILTKLRENNTSKADRVADGTPSPRRTRKNAKTSDVPD